MATALRGGVGWVGFNKKSKLGSVTRCEMFKLHHILQRANSMFLCASHAWCSDFQFFLAYYSSVKRTLCVVFDVCRSFLWTRASLIFDFSTVVALHSLNACFVEPHEKAFSAMVLK